MQRKASAVWQGGLKDGKGTVSSASGVLSTTPYSFATRFENNPGTNPEELIANVDKSSQPKNNFSELKNSSKNSAGLKPLPGGVVGLQTSESLWESTVWVEGWNQPLAERLFAVADDGGGSGTSRHPPPIAPSVPLDASTTGTRSIRTASRCRDLHPGRRHGCGPPYPSDIGRWRRARRL